jgi:UDP-MurNAc hydroxylase
MRITQLGHASLYVETADLRVLVDPVLFDPFEEGVFEVFPRRTVRWEALPPFEILFVSHRHLDHFDVATLSRCPRDVQVVIPDDPIMAEAFDELGYKSVERVRSFSTFTVGSTRFLVTPSEAPTPEHGLLVSDPSGTFWNQVDTVLGPKQIDLVLEQSGVVNLLLATWQPMLEIAWQHNQPLSFPWTAYERLLANILRIRPTALAPGSNGYCFAGDASWMNHIVFPQSRERFLKDIVSMLPELEGSTFAFDPGDVLNLRDGEVRFHHRESAFVTSDERDPFELEFTPPTARRPLRDAESVDEEGDSQAVERFVQQHFPAFIRDNPALFSSHRDWGVIYQLEVAYKDRSSFWWCDLSMPDARLTPGKNPLANFMTGITASALLGLLAQRRGWGSVILNGSCYHFHKVYGVWKNGIVLPTHVEIFDPIELIFPSEAASEALIRNQLGEAMASDVFPVIGPAG